MPRTRVKIEDYSSVPEAEGFASAPLPPNGTYRYLLKRLKLVNNSSGDPMLKALFVMADLTGKFDKHNDSACWWNGNLTKQGAPFVNRALNALGINLKDVWTSRMMVDDDDDQLVVKIGPKKLDPPLAVMISVKNDTDNKGRPIVNATDFFPAKAGTAKPKDEDEYGDDDDEDEVEITDEDEDEDGEPPF